MPPPTYTYTPNPLNVNKDLVLTFNVTITDTNLIDQSLIYRLTRPTNLPYGQTLATYTPKITLPDTGLNGAYGLLKVGTDMYVTSFNDNKLSKINLTNNTISEISLSGDVVSGGYNSTDIKIYGGDLYVANWSAGTVSKIVLSGNTGVVSTFISSGLNNPTGLMFIGTTLYVLHDVNGGTIATYDATNGILLDSSFASGLGDHNGMVYDGTYLYIPNGFGGYGINRVDLSGNVTSITLSGDPLSQPRYLAFDTNGILYATNDSGSRISTIILSGTNGNVSTYITSLNRPQGIVIDSDNNLFVASYQDSKVYEYSLYSLHYTNVPDSSLPYGSDLLTVYNNNNVQVYQFYVDVSCYNEDTQILCYHLDQEKYLPIQELKKDMLVKTFKDGYKKITHIGTKSMRNNPSKWNHCMYKMNKTDDMTDDLIVTGYHSILVNNMSNDELEKHKLLNVFKGEIRQVDGKYLTVAGISDKFTKLDNRNIYKYYHFVLESDNQDNEYGIYANGVLSESTSETQYKIQKYVNL